MWSYYGRKSKVIKYYPEPIYDYIIEPFAGTACYSLRYWEKNCVLVDNYSVIIDIWKYLQQASEKDILSLPDMEKGDKVPSLLADEERWLMGFCINRGSQRPKITASGFCAWNRNKEQIAENLYKIRHWKIFLGEYHQLKNKETKATWYIDPPYQFGGELYQTGINFDFSSLAEWCKSRNGQIIVCENTKADWLPFKPLKSMQGQRNKTTEAIYINEMAK